MQAQSGSNPTVSGSTHMLQTAGIVQYTHNTNLLNWKSCKTKIIKAYVAAHYHETNLAEILWLGFICVLHTQAVDVIYLDPPTYDRFAKSAGRLAQCRRSIATAKVHLAWQNSMEYDKDQCKFVFNQLMYLWLLTIEQARTAAGNNEEELSLPTLLYNIASLFSNLSRRTAMPVWPGWADMRHCFVGYALEEDACTTSNR